MEGSNGSREFVERLRTELPRLLRDDVEVRGQIIALLSDYLTTRQETAAILAEIREMRADFDRRMDELGVRLDEQGRRLDEQGQRLEEQGQRLEEQGRRLEEQGRRLDEQGRRLEEHTRVLLEHTHAIERQGERFDEFRRFLGGLGARWGVMTEEAFRRSVRVLLEAQPEIHVERWKHRDQAGRVFGYPADVDMDVVIRDGTVTLIEIKSSVSGGDVLAFRRRVELYREVTGRQPTRVMMISPYIDDRAREVAGALHIELIDGVTPPPV